jgi:hypothetical protein
MKSLRFSSSFALALAAVAVNEVLYFAIEGG